jgi:hypothetical protein
MSQLVKRSRRNKLEVLTGSTSESYNPQVGGVHRSEIAIFIILVGISIIVHSFTNVEVTILLYLNLLFLFL